MTQMTLKLLFLVKNTVPEAQKLGKFIFRQGEADFNGLGPWEGLPDPEIEVSDPKYIFLSFLFLLFCIFIIFLFILFFADFFNIAYFFYLRLVSNLTYFIVFIGPVRLFCFYYFDFILFLIILFLIFIFCFR